MGSLIFFVAAALIAVACGNPTGGSSLGLALVAKEAVSKKVGSLGRGLGRQEGSGSSLTAVAGVSIDLGCFTQFGSGFTKKAGCASEVAYDIAQTKQSSMEDAISVLVKGAKAVGLVYDAYWPGFGRLFSNMVIAMFKTTFCVNAKKSGGASYLGYLKGKSSNVCKPDYCSQYGYPTYEGSYIDVTEVQEFYKVDSAESLCNSYLDKWTKGKGMDSLTGSSRTAAECTWELAKLMDKPSHQWNEQDIASVVYQVTLAMGSLGESVKTGLGIELSDSLLNYYNKCFKECNFPDMSGYAVRIKKTLKECNDYKCDWGGALRREGGTSGSSYPNQDEGQCEKRDDTSYGSTSRDSAPSTDERVEKTEKQQTKEQKMKSGGSHGKGKSEGGEQCDGDEGSYVEWGRSLDKGKSEGGEQCDEDEGRYGESGDSRDKGKSGGGEQWGKDEGQCEKRDDTSYGSTSRDSVQKMKNTDSSIKESQKESERVVTSTNSEYESTDERVEKTEKQQTKEQKMKSGGSHGKGKSEGGEQCDGDEGSKRKKGGPWSQGKSEGGEQCDEDEGRYGESGDSRDKGKSGGGEQWGKDEGQCEKRDDTSYGSTSRNSVQKMKNTDSSIKESQKESERVVTSTNSEYESTDERVEKTEKQQTKEQKMKSGGSHGKGKSEGGEQCDGDEGSKRKKGGPWSQGKSEGGEQCDEDEGRYGESGDSRDKGKSGGGEQWGKDEGQCEKRDDTSYGSTSRNSVQKMKNTDSSIKESQKESERVVTSTNSEYESTDERVEKTEKQQTKEQKMKSGGSHGKGKSEGGEQCDGDEGSKRKKGGPWSQGKSGHVGKALTAVGLDLRK